MIGYLRGKVMEFGPEGLVLDVNGVGYDLQCSLNTIADVQGRDDVHLWVHTHLREDALNLFGFSTPTERKMFLSLVKVNGIGPKMAVKILSATALDSLIDMIEAGNVKGLSGLPKVGKKTAEQLILTLKGKLVVEEAAVPAPLKEKADIISALVNLGFKPSDVEKAVAQLPDDIDLQAGVRQGLQALSGHY